jgi:hypothetical protein
MARGTAVDAVGRITSTMTGTGFLIDKTNRHIVTCRHVVAGQRVARFELPRLGFAVDCDVEAPMPEQHDWALLTARDSLPEQAAELPLHQFRWAGCGLPFTSYGFASLYARTDAGFVSGQVRGVLASDNDCPTQIDLFVHELAGKTHRDAQGLSGAPCLVGGVAVGVVWASLEGGAGSTLRVISADVLHRESDRQIPLVGGVPLPYEERFFDALSHAKRSALDIAGAAVGLDADACDDDTYRRHLARAMIHGGLGAAVNALVELQDVPERRRKEIALLAESLWIDAHAAEQASSLGASSLPHSFLWNATYDASTLDLLRRACWQYHRDKRLNSALLKWPNTCLLVHLPTGEVHAADLIHEIAEQFRCVLRMTTPDEIRAFLAAATLSPVFAVIFDVLPSTEILRELARCYPGLRALFILPEPRADLPEVTVIRPLLTADQESESHRARDLARRELRIHSQLVIEERVSR